MGKLKRISSLFIVFLLIFSCSFSSYADVASGSDAIMTLDLDDEDYGIMPLSSIGTVTNTVVNKNSSVWVSIRYVDSSGVQRTRYPQVDFSNNRYSFSVSDLPAGSYINRIGFSMTRSSVPHAGGYLASMDFSSDFAVEYGFVRIYTENATDNAATLTTFDEIDFQQLSGDLYISPLEINLTSVDVFTFFIYPNSHDYSAFGGSFAVNFTPASVSSGALTTAGGNTSNEDYQSDVSGSLSDISSSIGDMSESLDSAAENLEYISTSQNLIIQGIDNVIMHISDQLYAFWDQLFNLIHLPQMAKMDEIIDAIENIDLEVNVNLDKLKSSIDTMNTDIQNKLQSTTDKITSGYDSSGLEAENSELSGAVTEYDQAEQEVMDSVTGNIDSFEYPDVETMPGGILAALSFFGGFMQSCFANMGDFNIVITLSLTMIFVLILVGYHRIRT